MLFLVLVLTLLFPLLQILLRLLGCQDGREVTLMVALQFRMDVNGQESLASENLRSGTLEVMIDNLHLVNLTLDIEGTQLTCDVNTRFNLGFVCQFHKISCRRQA